MVTTFVVFNSSCERYNGRRLNPLAVTTFPECSCSAIVCLIQSSTTGYTAANSSGVIAETTVAGEKADAVAIPSHKPIAVTLDFMNPRRSPRRLWGGLWQACGYEAYRYWGSKVRLRAYQIGRASSCPMSALPAFRDARRVLPVLANEKLCRLKSN